MIVPGCGAYSLALPARSPSAGHVSLSARERRAAMLGFGLGAAEKGR